MEFVGIILEIILGCCLMVCFVICIIKFEQYLEEKQGIKNRIVPISYDIAIYKTVNGDKYYLNNDGDYYTSLTNVRKYSFKSILERKTFLSESIECLKKEYGEDISIAQTTKYIWLGKCKKL